MKKRTKEMELLLLLLAVAVTITFFLSACADGGPKNQSVLPAASPGESSAGNSLVPTNAATPPAETSPPPSDTSNIQSEKSETEKVGIKLKITVADQELTATMEDNATTQAMLEKLPMTVTMLDLYNREMSYNFPDELPTDNVQASGYEVGDIIYWPPGRSLAIMYAQNDQRFTMQKIGRIDSSVEIFERTGDAAVTFERLDE